MSEGSEEEGVKVDLEPSVYSQVVFVDVPLCYPIYTDVICSYKLTGGLKPNPKNWIGIYKVGWESTQKYHCYEWTNSILTYNGCEQLVFGRAYLPMDDGEFYQFCYVDSNGLVRGVSTTFSFQNPAEKSEDSSILVVSTQEQVEQIEKEKEALLATIDDLNQGKAILKNELDERLQEIHRLRVYIDQLKTLSLKEHPESPQQDSLEQSFHSDTLAGTKAEHEFLPPNHTKYDKAILKISFLRQEKEQLKKQLMEKDAEISELKRMAKKTEHEYNRLQDKFQLQQVDMQSIQKDNERLCAKIDGFKWDIERLLEENKALSSTVSKEVTPEGDRSDTKMQILSLTNDLREVRGTLRKEIQNSSEANRRADLAEQELKCLQVMVQEKTVTEKSQIEMERVKACSSNSKQESIAETARLENKALLEENQKLKDDIERLQMIIHELSSAGHISNTQQHQNPSSPIPASLINTQQQPQLDSNLYENIQDFETAAIAENKVMECRHCRESFPDITEHELLTHEESHKVCPICTLICDDIGQQEFENHVYSHEE